MIINKKLLLNIILTTAGALILLGSFIIFCSKSIIHSLLLNRSQEQLMVIRDLKKQQLENFFHELRKNIDFLSNEPIVQTSFQDFKTAFEQVSGANYIDPQKQNYINLKIAQHYNSIVKQYKEHTGTQEKIDFSVFLQNLNPYSIILQTKYMTTQQENLENTELLDLYDNVHNKYHTFFQKITDEYKYNDLILIDLNGNIIYSTKKNIDFASSITSGSFSNTEIANIFNATRYANANENSAILSNFSEYLPDYQEPILFVAKKVQNIGVLIASVNLSTINALLKLPEKLNNTDIYLIDQDSRLMTINSFGKTITSLAAREAANGKKGFIEAPNKNNNLTFSYFSPIEYTGLNLIVESNKNAILRDLGKSINNMLLFTAAIIPILLFFLYTIYCLFIEKVDNRLKKISTFMQVVLAKKDLNCRINLNNTDAKGIADILNNMLAWFQNTLDKVAFKTKKFIDKYNNLFDNMTQLSKNIQDKQPILESTKETTNTLLTTANEISYNLNQNANAINAHKQACLALNDFNVKFNQKQQITNLNSSIEYILSICNLADMLALHLSLESAKNTHQQDNNFLILSKEIKKMVADLKSRLMQIKDSFDNYILEHESIQNVINELSEKLKPVNTSLEELLTNQQTLLDLSDNNKTIINNLNNNIVELETKYSLINQQLTTIVEHNEQPDLEVKTDDYYPFKIEENPI